MRPCRAFPGQKAPRTFTRKKIKITDKPAPIRRRACSLNVYVGLYCYNNKMKFNWRTAAALVILAVSAALLLWGFWPLPKETLILPVEPSNMILPAPSSFLPGLFSPV